MEFLFNVKSILPGSINVVDHELNVVNLDEALENGTNSEKWATSRSAGMQQFESGGDKRHDLIKIINVMGEASARAQNLQHSITSGERLQHTSDQSLYVITDAKENGDSCVVGILKMGRKKLFVVDPIGKLNDVNALCVLDFYVHESRQRRRFGKRLFDIMLMAEKTSPHELAIDRPSGKFVSFLCKHYNLRDMIPQPNNFAVFPGFFSQSGVAPSLKDKHITSIQRHSYAGSDDKQDGDLLFRRALKTTARPRSFNDIDRCLNWTEDNVSIAGLASALQNGSAPHTNDVTSLPTAKDASALDKRRSFPATLRRQQSTSWNLFGVPPPTYGN